MVNYKHLLCGVLIASMLPLAGCFNIVQDEGEVIIVDDESEEEEKATISPNINTPENYYRTVLQEGSYRHSEARGLVPAAISNRNDINQLELGLMEIASTRFPQDEYYFQEGQITGTEINQWLRRYDPDRQGFTRGLNPSLPEGEYPLLSSGQRPPTSDEERRERVRLERELHENHPSYLSHVMEHNYLKLNEDGKVELAGLVIGISLNSVYYYRVVDDLGFFHEGEISLEAEKIEEEGKRIAQNVLNRAREHYQADIPIVIALFQEERRQSIVPGNFISFTTVEPGKSIEKWERINERNYFFPSSEVMTDHREDAINFANFKDGIDGFFDNYVGIVGRGRYKGGQLQELTIEINLQSNGKAEIIAMTQFITAQIESSFHPSLPVSIYLTSLQGAESIIVRHSNEDPFVHIYR